MKKSNLSKLIVLMVFTGGISLSNSAFADDTLGFTLANDVDGLYYYGYYPSVYHGYIYGNSSDGNPANKTTKFSGNIITVYYGEDSYVGGCNKVSNVAVSGNKVYFKGGELKILRGGERNNAGDVGGDSIEKGNSVVVTGENPIYIPLEGVVAGGAGNPALNGGSNVSYNSVIISGDISNYNNYIAYVYGGRYGEKNFNNTVYINGGYVGKLYGGNGQEVHNNSVIIEGGKISASVLANKGVIYGGCSYDKEKDNYSNSVYIGENVGTGISGEYNIYGGYNEGSGDVASFTSHVRNNTVVIKSGTFTGTYASGIYGGYCVHGGFAGGPTLEDGNHVILDGGNYTNVYVYGGKGYNGAQYNTVEITDNCEGSFDYVYGGYVSSYSAVLSLVKVSNNSVIAAGVDIKYLIGGKVIDPNGESSYNSVYVDGGNIDNIIGGDGPKSCYNTVTIMDGNFKNISGTTSTNITNNNFIDIRGGRFDGIISGADVNDTCISNNHTIKISGGFFTENAELFGTKRNSGGYAYNSDGDKLIINDTSLKVKLVNGFQHYEFNVDSNIGKGDGMLSCGTIYLENSTIDVVLNEAIGNFETGEKIVLINGITQGSTLPEANLHIYTDTVGGTPYTGNAEFVFSGKQLLLGNLAPDYILKNTTDSPVNYESGTDGIYDKIIGYSEDGTSDHSNGNYSNNSITINQGYYTNIIGGAEKNNEINVFGGYIWFVYGALAQNYEDVGGINTDDGNSVVVHVSNMISHIDKVWGGCTEQSSHTVLNNKVVFTGDCDCDIGCTDIYGGLSRDALVAYNTVKIHAGIFNATRIYGGCCYTGNADAKNNLVEIEGGIFGTATKIYGGYTSGTGVSSGNKLVLRNKKIDVDTIDKFQEIDLCLGDKITKEDGNTAMINTINAIDISDVSINVALNGIDYDMPENEGIILLGKVTGVSSDMNIYTGEIGGEIYSADDLKIVVSGEKVLLGNYVADYTIINDNSDPQISFKSGFLATGAYTSDIQGNVDNDGTSANNNYSGNVVNIYLGEYNTNIYGAKSTGNDAVTENKVHVKGGTFTGHAVYGAYSNGNVNTNSVEISDGLFKDAGNKVYGGYSVNDEANNNYVKVENGTFQDTEIYGGYSATGNADNNKVEIVDGDFSTGTVKIVGGGVGDTTKATNNNVVDIAGGTFGSNVSLIGGQGVSTGNKLEYRVSGQTFNSVRDFQEMNFYLPTDTDVTGATPLMTVTNEVTIDAVVNVYNPNNIALADGDIVTLIHDTSGNKFQDTFTEMQGGNVLGQTMNISGTKFVNQYAELGFDDDTNPTKLQMKVQSSPEVTSDEDVLKAPVEGMAAAAHAVNTVSDLASTQGMENMTNVTANSETAESFAASNIGKQKLKSGSHVDVHGYALVAGVAKKTTNDNGDKVTTGLFFEYGNNDFDTYQDNGYHGEGSSVSRGGGLMWKYESVNGSYYEGMLHAGRVKTNWKSNELNGGYETNSIYYGGAATYGYKLMMEERKQLKFYASYMYGHTADSDVNVGGADYHFDSVKSHRTRLGVRYMHSDLMEQNKVRPYIGFAWEHEFDGEARADVSVGSSTISAPAPTMKGNTGIMDIGCTWDTGRWTVSLGGEMYVGKRRGWNGMLSLTLNF